VSAAPTPGGHGLGGRAPAWLRAPAKERPQGAGARLAETVVLLLAGVLLATATINDLVRETNVNHRLVADKRTWRAYTHHDYKNLSVSQDVRGLSTREIACGNTSPGGLKERVQLCLTIAGPVRDGRRRVSGGWYLPPRLEDERRYRYACFGAAVAERLCPR
jgi:hypothetical protein